MSDYINQIGPISVDVRIKTTGVLTLIDGDDMTLSPCKQLAKLPHLLVQQQSDKGHEIVVIPSHTR